MSTPVQNERNNDNAEDLQVHAAQQARELPQSELAAQPSIAAQPNRPQPRNASPNRTSWAPPSLWPRATESPPTAPVQDVAQNSLQDNAQKTAEEMPQASFKESKGNKADSDARRLKVDPSVLHPQSAPRMPRGLGGPNIGLPIGPQLPRTPQSAPPGVAGIAAAWPPSGHKPEFEGDQAIKALRQRLSLDPEFVPPPQLHKRSASVMPTVGRLALVVLVAGLVAGGITLLSFDHRPELLAMFKRGGDTTVGASLLAGLRDTSQQQPAQPTPHLVVEGRQTFANEGLSLGISLDNASGSEFALLTGLTTGTRLSVGGPFGANGWKIPAHDLGNAMAYAPKDFVGVMEAAIDLRLPNNTLIDSQPMRLEWVPKQPEVRAPQLLPQREEARPTSVVRVLDPAEADLLIRRAQEYLTTGDIVSARLALRRVAAAGNAKAALTLGASFDPVVFEQLGVLGFAADVAQARTWYQRAAELGSPEATRRLERLGKMAP